MMMIRTVEKLEKFGRRNENRTFARVGRELEGGRLRRQGGSDGRSLWIHQSKHHDCVGDYGDNYGDDGDDEDCDR